MKEYAISFDIGTTTIAAYLVDISEGEFVASSSVTNPQAQYGADVITRIHYAIQSEENARRLHDVLIAGLDNIALDLVRVNKVNLDQVQEIVVVGNTTMCHTFLGEPLDSLAVAPFDPAYKGSRTGVAIDLGFQNLSHADYYVAPGIGGHVGSDITVGIWASDLHLDSNWDNWVKDADGKIVHTFGYFKEDRLLVDIGTNSEIVLKSDKGLLCCSTAAGPAFEGWGLKCGMRAKPGAIERVSVAESAEHISTGAGMNDIKGKDIKFDIGVIGGDTHPRGICGSGIIDTVAALLETGYLDDSGKLVDDRVVLARGSDGRDIFVDQKDIREIQLAKGAIEAGMKVLFSEAGVDPTRIESVYVAGAFGNHINVESAIKIGLIPGGDSSNVKMCGNLAGEGAVCLAYDREARSNLDWLEEEVCHIELSNHPEFEKFFIESLNF